MAEQHRAVRALVTLLRVLAWTVAIFGSLTVGGAAITTGFQEGDVVRGATIMVAGLLTVALSAFLLFAAGGFVALLVDIEYNTRIAAQLLSRFIEE